MDLMDQMEILIYTLFIRIIYFIKFITIINYNL